jgi:hypothetical protein
MWRLPVTFGGGMTMQNGGFSLAGSAVKYPASTHRWYSSASTVAGSQAGGRSGLCCDAVSVTLEESTNSPARLAFEFRSPHLVNRVPGRIDDLSTG